MKDLTGIRFGKWIVIHRVTKPAHLKNKDVYWNCQCDCGTFKIIKGASLKSGRSKSCGCPRKEIVDLLNQKFGQLIVIGIGIFDKNVIFYPCRCDCSNEVMIRYHDLIRKDTKAILSCGHSKIHSIPEEARLSTARTVYRDSYNDGNLSFGKFLELCQLDCHYCGKVPKNSANIFKKKLGSSDFAIEHGNFIYNGLDRIDNNKDHDVENLVPCCIKCNWAKNKMGYEEFLDWISTVYKYRIEK